MHFINKGKVKASMQKVLKIYQSKLGEIIRGSLLYNLFKMSILVVFIVWVMFILSPTSAYVYFKTDSGDFSCALNAEFAYIENSSDFFRLSGFKEMQIDFSGKCKLLINGKEYDDSYSIKIKNMNLDTSSLVFRNINENTKIVTGFLSTTPAGHIFYKSTQDESSIICQDKLTAYPQDNVCLTFDKAEGTLIKDGYPDIKIDTCSIYAIDQNEYSLDFLGSSVLEFFDESQSEKSITKMQLYRVVTVKQKATGKVNFSYSPESKELSIIDQELFLESANENLRIDIEIVNQKQKVVTSGIVKYASISGMSLFPTLEGWYRSNIYLAPLSLVTIVFGGVALMKKKKDNF